MINDWREDWESTTKTFPVKLLVYCICFFIEDQLSELEIGEDVGIMFQKYDMLEGNDDRMAFKEALSIIGRMDIRMQLGIYLAAGK